MTNLDLYCERLGPQFWAEPINAWTNLGFALAALVGLWLLLERRLRYPKLPHPHWLLSLPLLIFLIAVGSFLFHTFATPWARWADVLPILAYQYVFFSAYLFYGLRLSLKASLLWPVPYIGATVLARVIPIPYSGWLNGSIPYLPSLLVLVGLGWVHLKRCKKGTLLLAAGLLALSLLCRSLDMALCSTLPFGSHWAWHLLNSVMLAVSVKALCEALTFHYETEKG